MLSRVSLPLQTCCFRWEFTLHKKIKRKDGWEDAGLSDLDTYRMRCVCKAFPKSQHASWVLAARMADFLQSCYFRDKPGEGNIFKATAQSGKALSWGRRERSPITSVSAESLVSLMLVKATATLPPAPCHRPLQCHLPKGHCLHPHDSDYRV